MTKSPRFVSLALFSRCKLDTKRRARGFLPEDSMMILRLRRVNIKIRAPDTFARILSREIESSFPKFMLYKICGEDFLGKSAYVRSSMYPARYEERALSPLQPTNERGVDEIAHFDGGSVQTLGNLFRRMSEAELAGENFHERFPSQAKFAKEPRLD